MDRTLAAVIATGCVATITEAIVSGRAPMQNTMPASRCPVPEQALTVSQIEFLQEKGYVVVDNFLSKDQVRRACETIRSLDENGKFKLNSNDDETVRTDRVFMYRSNQNDVEEPEDVKKVAGLQGVRAELISMARGLTESNFAGFAHSDYESSRLCIPQEMQVSIFEKCNGQGQFFTSHVDSAGAEDFHDLGLLGWLRSYYLRQRYLTCIVYLNEDWKPEDAGCLRLHHRGSTALEGSFDSSSYIDVEPVAGRLVVLSSLNQWHAVLPTNAKRFACSFFLSLGDK